MLAFEIVLLVITYTLMIIALFLQVLCYRKNLEPIETILLTISLLLLVISFTISPFWDNGSVSNTTNVMTLVSMTLVGMTTPLDIFAERINTLSKFWKILPIAISGLLLLIIGYCYFFGSLYYVQYAVACFLGISILSSMLFARSTKPHAKYVKDDNIEQKFYLAFLILIPLSLISDYIFPEPFGNLNIGLTIPLILILLVIKKIMTDVYRLRLLNKDDVTEAQVLQNFALTKRENEIALILIKGKSYDEISKKLHISIPTVKTHASNIYKKCQVKSKHELALLVSR